MLLRTRVSMQRSCCLWTTSRPECTVRCTCCRRCRRCASVCSCLVTTLTVLLLNSLLLAPYRRPSSRPRRPRPGRSGSRHRRSSSRPSSKSGCGGDRGGGCSRKVVAGSKPATGHQQQMVTVCCWSCTGLGSSSKCTRPLPPLPTLPASHRRRRDNIDSRIKAKQDKKKQKVGMLPVWLERCCGQ